MSLWSYEASAELSDEQYRRWQTLLEQRTGISFLQHKSILQKGLSQRMREAGFSNYDEYFALVSQVPEGAVEWARLVDRVSVKETSFFREPQSFNLVRNFLAEYIQGRPRQPSINLWSVGCSTGEEAYSLAMVASDVIDFIGTDIFYGVVATDISRIALGDARKGEYGKRKLETVPLAIRNKHIESTDEGNCRVKDSLKQRVCFVQGNIVEFDRLPKMNMDVIFCQNVLVYFERHRLKAVLDSLVRHLNPGGLLVLGPGEVSNWQHPQMQRNSDDTVLAFIKQPDTH
jgi:chemotaxis protein methyltransferase CheR/type IV pilus assembly protein PilK